MTKFSTYQRPRTGTASGPFGPAGNGPRWVVCVKFCKLGRP